jgi:hypothetical protein
MTACARGCISNVGEGVECDEYITQRHGKFRQKRAASGRCFDACEYGEAKQENNVQHRSLRQAG